MNADNTTTRNDPRLVAVKIITGWIKDEGPIDAIRDRMLSGESGWDDRDRALVTELVFGIARHREELDRKLDELVQARLDRMQHNLHSILLVGLYQLLFLDRIPVHAVVDSSVSLARQLLGEGPTGLVNAVLRRAGEQKKSEAGPPGEPEKRPVDAFYTGKGPLHNWRNKWTGQWGPEKTEELIRYFAEVPSVGLRRNLLRTANESEWLEILSSEGVVAPQQVPGCEGYCYVKGVRPDSLPSFEKGITTVQDPAAGIAPAMLNPQPGEKVLDLCCAPGGKTALIWERMGGKGSLLAVDRSLKRNRKTREGLKRLGHTGVNILTDDVMTMDEGKFDRVLVDVPCSGTGVARRRADLLFKRHPLQATEMSKLQRSLLEHAAGMVSEGGILVYSTCSLEPEENENRIGVFEKKLGKEFERDNPPDTVPLQWLRGTGEAGTWPPKDRIDGVYAVRWRRVK